MKFVYDTDAKYFDTGIDIGSKHIFRSKRIEQLRSYLLGFEPELCTERMTSYTESYRQTEAEPICIRRAKAFKKATEDMTISILDHELFLGNFASTPRGVPLYPEFSVKWMIEELDGKPVHPAARPGDSFRISPENERIVRQNAAYWLGKTHEDRCLARLPEQAWKAHEQGAFNSYWLMTGGEGHITVNLKRVAQEGLLSFKERALAKMNELDLQDREDSQKMFFLQSVVILTDAILAFSGRYAKKARQTAEKTGDAQRKAELLLLADICERVPAHPARTFHEALQAYWFTNLCLELDNNGFAMSLGRMDKNLYPYYERDLASGELTEADASELLSSFFLKIFQLNRIQNWDSTQYFGGYQKFENITLCGQDEYGRDCTNALSFLLIETQARIRLHQPSLSLRYHDRIGNKILQAAIDCVKLGGGQPAIYSDESYMPALINRGVKLEDACEYSIVGCAEAIVEGRQGTRPSGSAYTNLGKIMEIAIHGGYDPETDTQLIRLKGLNDSETFEEFYESLRQAIEYYVHQEMIVDTSHDVVTEEGIADPLISMLTDDCIDRGKTIKQGGAIYDFLGQQFVGVANFGNSLAAIKKLIFDDKTLTKDQLLHALRTNFEDAVTSPTGAEILKMALAAPKYGNDEDYADELLARAFRFACDEIAKYKTPRYGRGPIGCVWQPSVSSVSANVPNGMYVGALPDGRLKNTPLADTISPTHGSDTNGPTAVLKSASKLPTMLLSGGVLLNMRLNPTSVQKASGREKLIMMLRTFLGDLKGMHVQFNMINGDTLRAAQAHPDQYKDLMVRVAGYSALFTPLDPELQNDIIGRTEHAL
ncbi:MAG TPA: formate C-acetyltransferase/glycerol dehydratase family glycyl radical enzyme [Clostridiales bacterium]|nr:formate C-acetyltransferase/glycerol dehydratase family glycyl radical enzyme [Clostridiales bacterium]